MAASDAEEDAPLERAASDDATQELNAALSRARADALALVACLHEAEGEALAWRRVAARLHAAGDAPRLALFRALAVEAQTAEGAARHGGARAGGVAAHWLAPLGLWGHAAALGLGVTPPAVPRGDPASAPAAAAAPPPLLDCLLVVGPTLAEVLRLLLEPALMHDDAPGGGAAGSAVASASLRAAAAPPLPAAAAAHPPRPSRISGPDAEGAAAAAAASSRTRAALAEAIALGYPLFNAGEVRACADLYAAAATKLLREGCLAGPAGAEVAAALSAAHGSDEDRAWALRNAFNTVLGVEQGLLIPRAPQKKGDHKGGCSGGGGGSGGDAASPSATRAHFATPLWAALPGARRGVLQPRVLARFPAPAPAPGQLLPPQLPLLVDSQLAEFCMPQGAVVHSMPVLELGERLRQRQPRAAPSGGGDGDGGGVGAPEGAATAAAAAVVACGDDDGGFSLEALEALEGLVEDASVAHVFTLQDGYAAVQGMETPGKRFCLCRAASITLTFGLALGLGAHAGGARDLPPALPAAITIPIVFCAVSRQPFFPAHAALLRAACAQWRSSMTAALRSLGAAGYCAELLPQPAAEFARATAAAAASSRTRAVLIEAITLGAPLFNAGKARACADLYAAAAVELLREGCLAGPAGAEVAVALSALHGSDEDRAWALRNVFDKVLGTEQAALLSAAPHLSNVDLSRLGEALAHALLPPRVRSLAGDYAALPVPAPGEELLWLHGECVDTGALRFVRPAAAASAHWQLLHVDDDAEASAALSAWTLPTLLSLLRPDQLVLVLGAALTEHKVIFVGGGLSLQALTASTLALGPLLFPLSWCSAFYSLAPILPEELVAKDGVGLRDMLSPIGALIAGVQVLPPDFVADDNTLLVHLDKGVLEILVAVAPQAPEAGSGNGDVAAALPATSPLLLPGASALCAALAPSMAALRLSVSGSGPCHAPSDAEAAAARAAAAVVKDAVIALVEGARRALAAGGGGVAAFEDRERAFYARFFESQMLSFYLQRLEEREYLEAAEAWVCSVQARGALWR
jgi:hypothetical protein